MPRTIAAASRPLRSGSSERYSKHRPPAGWRLRLSPGPSTTDTPSDRASSPIAPPTSSTSVDVPGRARASPRSGSRWRAAAAATPRWSAAGDLAAQPVRPVGDDDAVDAVLGHRLERPEAPARQQADLVVDSVATTFRDAATSSAIRRQSVQWRRVSVAASLHGRRRLVAAASGHRAGSDTVPRWLTATVTLDLDGHEVRVTQPGQGVLPATGETKLDLVEYYLAVGRAAPARRWAADRCCWSATPTARAASRSSRSGCPKGAPDWLTTTVVATPNGTTSNALVAVDLAHVVWAVNMGCLGFHVWPYHAADPEHADELRIDLDPRARARLRRHPRGGAAGARRCSTSSASRRGPKTTGVQGPPRLRAPGAPVGLLPGPRRRRRAGPRARAPPPGPDDRGVVEGGAGPARVRRLQPERAAQDRVRRVVGPTAASAPRCRRRSRWDELDEIDPTRSRSRRSRTGCAADGRSVGGHGAAAAVDRAAARAGTSATWPTG